MPATRQAIYSLLQKCSQTKDLAGGRHAHSLILLQELDSVGILCDHLLRCFASCGSLLEVNLVFTRILTPSLHTWHAIMSAYTSFGEHCDAILLYHIMQDEGFQPDKFIYACTLKACSGLGALMQGRLVHIETICMSMDEEHVLQTTIADMYAKCGSLKDAHVVFDGLPNKGVVLWCALIAGYVQHGQFDSALKCFEKMLKEGLSPDRASFLSILKACASTGAIRQGLLVHALSIVVGLEHDVVLGNTIIDTYAKCGSLEDAHSVFNALSNHDLISWGALMTGYAQHGSGLQSLQLLEKMNQEGLQPDKVSFSCSVKACTENNSFFDGMHVYDMVTRSGFDTNVSVGNSLVDMFAKVGCLDEAQKVFGRMQSRNVVSWNAMISGHVQHGNGLMAFKLFEQMQQMGVAPDKATYVCILRSCSSVGVVEQEYAIHDKLVQSGLPFDTRLGNTLIDVYCKFGRLDDACNVFNSMSSRDAATWSAIIAGHAQHASGFQAFELFERVKSEGIKLDQPLFLCIIKACSSNTCLIQGRIVHGLVIKQGSMSDMVIGNSLVDMYAKCGSLNEAYAVFKRLPSQDTISWGTIIAAYCYQGLGSRAFELFNMMQRQGIEADKVTMTTLLKACAITGKLLQGMVLHNEMVRSGVDAEFIVGNALVDFYAKCASLDQAYKMFESLPNRDAVTWGALITGYVQFEQNILALQLFERMHKRNMLADEITFSCILKACSGMGLVEQGKMVHDISIRSGYISDGLIGNAGVDMYSKFGFLEEARKLFDNMSVRDVVTWNAMILGYVQHGHGFPAIQLFNKMQEDRKKPDNITYTCTLKACGCVGAIKQGRLIHDQVIRNGAIGELTVGNTLVDMYANCGSLDEACRSFEKLSCRNAVSWNAMIAGYAELGSFKMASHCLKRMQEDGFKPDACSYTSILAACSQEGCVEEGRLYFKSMRDDHGLTPSSEHLNCMIELLGSAGRLQEAEKLLQSMPIVPDMTGWMTLLGACKTFGNFGTGRVCFEQAQDLDFTHAAGYVLMSNICTDTHRWKDVKGLLAQRKEASAWKKPGMAWMELHSKVHEFVVAEKSHPQSCSMYSKLGSLERSMMKDGFVPQVDMVLESCETLKSPYLRENG